ncbi:carbohydrate ABC transporter permease [Streptacidiphilus sp. N1-12]|uniref:Carbohydrate ABC transporter permease n=2 Tax=Streptacidiphilus alkalitolerans TaxID=3342712 RepID=A0ABV6VIN0_9ACTN
MTVPLRLRTAAARAAAVLVGLLFLLPFYYVLVTSLNSQSASASLSDILLPHWQWANYSRAWAAAPWPRLFLNTVLIASATVLLALVTSLLAGFAFGVMRFRGRGLLFSLVLAVLMVPGTVLIIPDYMIANDIHWLDTYWIQIVPWGASVFGIFLVRQFFMGLPQELFDAAELDGAGRLRMLWSIGVPLVRPALLIITLNVFLASWNSFLWPFIMTQSAGVQPVEVGLAAFAGSDGTDYTGLSAAVVFTTVPVLAFFLALQRHFITGAMSTAGGVRG